MLKIIHKGTRKEQAVEWEIFCSPEKMLLTSLEEFETEGWTVHTVERRYSETDGEYFWILVRRVNKPVTNTKKMG